jgi:hypothetical protein
MATSCLTTTSAPSRRRAADAGFVYHPAVEHLVTEQDGRARGTRPFIPGRLSTIATSMQTWDVRVRNDLASYAVLNFSMVSGYQYGTQNAERQSRAGAGRARDEGRARRACGVQACAAAARRGRSAPCALLRQEDACLTGRRRERAPGRHGGTCPRFFCAAARALERGSCRGGVAALPAWRPPVAPLERECERTSARGCGLSLSWARSCSCALLSPCCCCLRGASYAITNAIATITECSVACASAARPTLRC